MKVAWRRRPILGSQCNTDNPLDEILTSFSGCGHAGIGLACQTDLLISDGTDFHVVSIGMFVVNRPLKGLQDSYQYRLDRTHNVSTFVVERNYDREVIAVSHEMALPPVA